MFVTQVVNLMKMPSAPKLLKYLFILNVCIFLAACSGGDDDDDDELTGSIKLYNASPDSPSIFLTIDEDLDNDEEDEIERTLASVSFANAGSKVELNPQTYFLELAWQDENSIARTDLEIVYEDQVEVIEDVTQWIFMTGSVENPDVQFYEIPEIDSDESSDDRDDDLFNVRMLNLHTDIEDVDVYLSLADQTFNEAILINSLQSLKLSENSKITQDQYIVYITLPGSDGVLFTSEEINFVTGNQYLLILRENLGIGGSEFVVDNATSTLVTEYKAADSVANLSLYNGLNINDLIADYDAVIDFSIEGRTTVPLTSGLTYTDFTGALELSSSDYSLSIFNNSNNETLLQNKLISAPQNSDRTVFLYWTDEPVDNDNDGNVDENDDGIVDEYRPIVSTLVVENSNRNRLYDKQITLLNLLNTDLFNSATFYFVKSDEIIDTTANKRSLALGTSSSIVLLNNTYQVFVVAEIDNNEIILHESTLTLNEDSEDLFLLIEDSDISTSGFAVRTESQRGTEE